MHVHMPSPSQVTDQYFISESLLFFFFFGVFTKVKPNVCNCKQTKRIQEMIWLLHICWVLKGFSVRYQASCGREWLQRPKEWNHWYMVADVSTAPVLPPCSLLTLIWLPPHDPSLQHVWYGKNHHVLTLMLCLPGVRHCWCFSQVVPWHQQVLCYCPACQESLLEKTQQDPHRVAQDFGGSCCPVLCPPCRCGCAVHMVLWVLTKGILDPWESRKLWSQQLAWAVCKISFWSMYKPKSGCVCQLKGLACPLPISDSGQKEMQEQGKYRGLLPQNILPSPINSYFLATKGLCWTSAEGIPSLECSWLHSSFLKNSSNYSWWQTRQHVPKQEATIREALKPWVSKDEEIPV